MVENILNSYKVKVEAEDYDSVDEERDALINGEIDAICRVAGLPDPIVKELLKREGMSQAFPERRIEPFQNHCRDHQRECPQR